MPSVSREDTSWFEKRFSLFLGCCSMFVSFICSFYIGLLSEVTKGLIIPRTVLQNTSVHIFCTHNWNSENIDKRNRFITDYNSSTAVWFPTSMFFATFEDQYLSTNQSFVVPMSTFHQKFLESLCDVAWSVQIQIRLCLVQTEL